MNSKIPDFTAGLVLLLTSPAFATDNPARDYATTFGLPDSEELLVVSHDLSGDGVAEVLVSHAKALNGRAGNIWMVYLATSNGYERLDRPVSLRRDALSAWLPSGQDFGVTTFHPGPAGSGSLVTWYVLDGKVQTVAENIDTPQDSVSLYDQVFASQRSLRVVTTKARTLDAHDLETEPTPEVAAPAGETASEEQPPQRQSPGLITMIVVVALGAIVVGWRMRRRWQGDDRRRT